MGLFGKLFGQHKAEAKPSEGKSLEELKADPNLIQVFDKYGRALFLDKEEWRKDILPDVLRKDWNDPDRLYSIIVGTIRDGLHAAVLDAARHLYKIDRERVRSACALSIVLIENGRLDEAEEVLDSCIAESGEDGYVLCNLAKVYEDRGDKAKSEATLWHSLEVDPNQENALEWYVALQHEKGGDQASLNAWRRIGELPGSWRAQVWLAREALQRKDISAATDFYSQVLRLAGRPVPADVLMQMSGDLGKNGYLQEIISLVAPLFDPAFHGLQVGNNILRANIELGRFDEARRILDRLYAQQRLDWREGLDFWDLELAKAIIAKKPEIPSKPFSVGVCGIEGPVWLRGGSPFAGIISAKPDGSVRLGILGSTAVTKEVRDTPHIQLPDAVGRLSRAIPLALTEVLHLSTSAAAIALIPCARHSGPVLFGKPYDDEWLLQVAGTGDKHPDFVAGLSIDATKPAWTIALRFMERAKKSNIFETEIEVSPEDPGSAVLSIADLLKKVLIERAGVKALPVPDWYIKPSGADYADYLIRLEQQLTIGLMRLKILDDVSLHGEREIIDGILQLCVRLPANPTVRIVLIQTIRLMKELRPAIFEEYRNRIQLLQTEKPLRGDIGVLIDEKVRELLR